MSVSPAIWRDFAWIGLALVAILTGLGLVLASLDASSTLGAEPQLAGIVLVASGFVVIELGRIDYARHLPPTYLLAEEPR